MFREARTVSQYFTVSGVSELCIYNQTNIYFASDVSLAINCYILLRNWLMPHRLSA